MEETNLAEVHMKQDIQALMDFLTRSVSPYHGVAEVLRILKEEGFEELPLTGDWTGPASTSSRTRSR